MNKTFTTLKTNVGTEIGDTSTDFATVIGRYLNRRYFAVLRAVNWNNIRYDYTKSLVSGTQDYALPDDFGKEIACQDVTNDNQLSNYDLSELYRLYGDSISDSGTVDKYTILDSPVIQQPASALQCVVVSSSASDTTQTLLIRYEDSNGQEFTETVTLNGTTNVTTTATIKRIKGISKSAVTTGKITITDGTNTLANLAPEQLISAYKLIRFHYVPTAVSVIHIPYIKKAMPLYNNLDYPVIDCGDLLEIGATADAWRYKRQFAKAISYENYFQTMLADMVFDMENQPNKVHQFLPATYDIDNLY